MLLQMLSWNSLVVSDKQTSEYCCHSREVQPEYYILQQMSFCVCLCDSWWKWKVITNSGQFLIWDYVGHSSFTPSCGLGLGLGFCRSKDTLLHLVSVFLPPQSPSQPVVLELNGDEMEREEGTVGEVLGSGNGWENAASWLNENELIWV